MQIDDFKRKEIDAARRESTAYRRFYDSVWYGTFARHENLMIMSLLPSVENLTVLDCGCGVGVLLKDLVLSASFVYGLDISLDSLRLVSISSSSLKGLVVGDAEHLPYRNAAFDALVLRATLHHIPDVDLALREFRRCLKPGGVLILLEPCGDSRLVRWGRKILSRRQERYFRTEELEELLRRSGFSCFFRRRTAYVAFLITFLFREFLSKLSHPIWLYRGCVRFLILVDNMLSHLPLIQKMNLGILVAARAPSTND